MTRYSFGEKTPTQPAGEYSGLRTRSKGCSVIVYPLKDGFSAPDKGRYRSFQFLDDGHVFIYSQIQDGKDKKDFQRISRSFYILPKQQSVGFTKTKEGSLRVRSASGTPFTFSAETGNLLSIEDRKLQMNSPTMNNGGGLSLPPIPGKIVIDFGVSDKDSPLITAVKTNRKVTVSDGAGVSCEVPARTISVAIPPKSDPDYTIMNSRDLVVALQKIEACRKLDLLPLLSGEEPSSAKSQLPTSIEKSGQN